MGARRRIHLTFALFAAILSSLALRAAPSFAVGDVHIVIIRSTTDEALNEPGAIWLNRLENMLENAPGATISNRLDVFGALEAAKNPGGLGRNDVATYIVLQTEESTHPDFIRKVCRAVSLKAGPDDAIMVIVECHGAAIVENGAVVHCLYPTAKSGDNLELGIRRGTILEELNARPHRLVVLITDTSFALRLLQERRRLRTLAIENDFAPKRKRGTATVRHDESYLKSFLQKARGVVNINSCSLGQRVFAITFRSKDNVAAEFGGSLFINAFCRFARNGLYLDSELNPDEFYRLLRIELARQVLLYNEERNNVVQNELTQFTGDGSPIETDPLEYKTAKDFSDYYQNRREFLSLFDSDSEGGAGRAEVDTGFNM